MHRPPRSSSPPHVPTGAAVVERRSATNIRVVNLSSTATGPSARMHQCGDAFVIADARAVVHARRSCRPPSHAQRATCVDSLATTACGGAEHKSAGFSSLERSRPSPTSRASSTPSASASSTPSSPPRSPSSQWASSASMSVSRRCRPSPPGQGPDARGRRGAPDRRAARKVSTALSMRAPAPEGVASSGPGARHLASAEVPGTPNDVVRSRRPGIADRRRRRPARGRERLREVMPIGRPIADGLHGTRSRISRERAKVARARRRAVRRRRRVPIASPAAASVRLPAPRGTPSPQLISNAVADRQQLYQRLKAADTPPRSAAMSMVSRHLDDVAGRLRASTPG